MEMAVNHTEENKVNILQLMKGIKETLPEGEKNEVDNMKVAKQREQNVAAKERKEKKISGAISEREGSRAS